MYYTCVENISYFPEFGNPDFRFLKYEISSLPFTIMIFIVNDSTQISYDLITFL